MEENPPPPAYLRPGAMPIPGKDMERLLPVPGAENGGSLAEGCRAALGAALAAILHRVPALSPQVAVTQALAALRKYGCALPAHTSDCALYDHARVCAAAAACLPDEPGPEPLALLVGDLSGIQRFVFGTMQGAGGS